MRWHNVGPTPSLLFADVGPTSFCSLALLCPNAWFFKVSQQRETFAYLLTIIHGKYYGRAKNA